jgi:hypothetical protein
LILLFCRFGGAGFWRQCKSGGGARFQGACHVNGEVGRWILCWGNDSFFAEDDEALNKLLTNLGRETCVLLKHQLSKLVGEVFCVVGITVCNLPVRHRKDILFGHLGDEAGELDKPSSLFVRAQEEYGVRRLIVLPLEQEFLLI